MDLVKAVTQSFVLITAFLIGNSCASPPQAESKSTLHPTSFAVYALSRGQGVPKAARDLLGQVEKLLNDAQIRGIQIKSSKFKIGLEGETKLCAEFSDPEVASSLLAQVKDLARGVELINVVTEPCKSEH